jgi:hypothetical protein
MFATFLNDVGGDLKRFVTSDWPHLLRDRLGLTHWPSTAGKPLPVALVCCTLDLAGSGIPDAFTPELLTFPIDYTPKHVKALGFISREHPLQEDEALFAARNRHMEGLRRLDGCRDFGEILS